MATDPTERVRQWTGAIFLAALAIVDVAAMAFELIYRHGVDPGVDSGIVVIAGIILAGPVGIKIIRGDRSNGGDS